jgi:hypothetical protein
MMHSRSLRTLPLRWTLAADAIVCSATGLPVLAFAGPLADALDLPATLLRVAGLLLVPYVAFLVMLVRRAGIPASGVWAAIAINIGWAIGCLAVLTGGWVDPNALGVAFVLVQAAGVLVIAELQYLGLRAMRWGGAR